MKPYRREESLADVLRKAASIIKESEVGMLKALTLATKRKPHYYFEALRELGCTVEAPVAEWSDTHSPQERFEALHHTANRLEIFGRTR